jgi:hypothetical protein
MRHTSRDDLMNPIAITHSEEPTAMKYIFDRHSGMEESSPGDATITRTKNSQQVGWKLGTVMDDPRLKE